ncbi:MAG: helix-turn-helix transcriptional regulator [Candidatus Dormibacteria bacterium]
MTSLDETSVEAHRALAGWTRVALLTCLRQADGPLDARELAQAVGLHVSTVRFHLGVLAEAGLVLAEFERRPRRGRPRQVWRSATELAVGPEGGYRMLAEVLAGYLESSSTEPRRRGDEIGRVWGAQLARARGDQEEPGVTSLVSILGDLGFSPEVVETTSETEIHLHSCPFLAVATENPELVCSVHLGLLRGALAETGASMVANELEPLVEPSLCIARLQQVEASSAG